MIEYQESQRVTRNHRASLARRLVAPVISRASTVALLVASIVAMTGCGTDPSRTEPSLSDVQRHPENFRCRVTKADGTCQSMPVNCPVTLPTPDGEPRVNCPSPGEIIPVEEDDCANKFICID